MLLSSDAHNCSKCLNSRTSGCDWKIDYKFQSLQTWMNEIEGCQLHYQSFGTKKKNKKQRGKILAPSPLLCNIKILLTLGLGNLEWNFNVFFSFKFANPHYTMSSHNYIFSWRKYFDAAIYRRIFLILEEFDWNKKNLTVKIGLRKMNFY